jgi:hypothetical protein
MFGIVRTSNNGELAMSVIVNVQVYPSGTYHFKETIYPQQMDLSCSHDEEAVILPQNTAANSIITPEPQELFY